MVPKIIQILTEVLKCDSDSLMLKKLGNTTLRLKFVFVCLFNSSPLFLLYNSSKLRQLGVQNRIVNDSNLDSDEFGRPNPSDSKPDVDIVSYHIVSISFWLKLIYFWLNSTKFWLKDPKCWLKDKNSQLQSWLKD